MSDCRCGRATRDHNYGCDECANALAIALGDVPWLDEELETTITRTKGVDYRTKGGTRGTERPSPASWGAVEARDHLKGVLVSWVLFSASENVRNQSTNQAIPADNLPAISRWLMWRIDGLMLLEIGLEAIDEITSAVAHCRRVIDRPADRQFLGYCSLCQAVGDEGRLYGRPGSAMATCSNCGDTIDADKLRERLLSELEDRLCTAGEIARLSTYLGLKADREQVRKRINKWASRDQLKEVASISDEPTYRFGAVYKMLTTAEYGGRKVAS